MKGFTVWIFGLSGSGKTTISGLVAEEIGKRGNKVELLDSESLRDRLNDGLGFTLPDRQKQATRLVYVSELLSRYGIICVVASVSPLKDVRDTARDELENFIEVYLKCDPETCAKREEKNLYTQLENGEISDLAGVDLSFEEPEAAEVVCDTAELDPEESTQKIIKKLEMLGLLTVTEVEDGYSEEEEKKVEERLRSLGYIE